MVIKSILREELANSLRMLERYEEELSKLPRGSITKRSINGHQYFYLIYRENGQFKSVYKGTSVSKEELQRSAQVKAQRAKYRTALSQLKKQIRYLKGTLRGKEEI